MSMTTKPTLSRILIFGASGHIGKPLTTYLTQRDPHVRLRLVTSALEKVQGLQKDFPLAEVVVANFFDLPSLERATSDVQGVFLITPSATDEQLAMTNIVTAFKKSNSVIHIIRLLGMFPEFNRHRIPTALQGGRSLPVQHPIAKAILDESGLPVTYINSGASFMDNFFLQIKSVQAEGKLIWPEHRVPFIDPRDIAEVAGQLLLSHDAKHIGQFHTMNNGADWLEFHEIAVILGDVLGGHIPYDDSEESFVRFYEPILGPFAVKSMWHFFKFEQANEVCWALNNFVERTIGRKPKTVREWLVEHREALSEGLRLGLATA
ncbi:NAD(P)-binding protein [Alternaria alternata]|nr:NAD(P)-binding protein [Alternaria alternata]